MPILRVKQQRLIRVLIRSSESQTFLETLYQPVCCCFLIRHRSALDFRIADGLRRKSLHPHETEQSQYPKSLCSVSKLDLREVRNEFRVNTCWDFDNDPD